MMQCFHIQETFKLTIPSKAKMSGKTCSYLGNALCPEKTDYTRFSLRIVIAGGE